MSEDPGRTRGPDPPDRLAGDQDEAAREFRRRMAEIVEQSPDFIATITPGGRLLSLNDSGRRMVGLSKDEPVAGRQIGSLFPSWARAVIEKEAHPKALEEGTWQGRSALVSPDGEEIPTTYAVVAHRGDGGAVRFLSAVARDATRRTREERRLRTEVDISQALEESESLESAISRLLEAPLRHLGADVVEFWVPGPTGKLLLGATTSPSLDSETDWGSIGDELVQTVAVSESGRILVHLMEDELTKPGNPKVSRVGAAIRPFRTALAFEARLATGLAGVVCIGWLTPYPDQGLLEMADRVGRDIASFVRRERAEASMLQAQMLAEEASVAKSNFLANMSHEIRTPMTAILGYADLLARSLDNPDDLQILQTVRRNAEHLLDIVNDILDLSKIEAGRLELRPQPTQTVQLVREMMHLMRLRAQEKGLDFGARTVTTLPRSFRTDPVRVRQILLNLLGNAIKFTETGRVTLRVTADKQCVHFHVDDTGIGIEPSVIDSLFEPFSQVDMTSGRAYQGSGLGLSISRRLARELGGSIQATSTPGEGSSFTLSLPLDEASAEWVEPDKSQLLVDAPEEIEYPAESPRLEGRVLVVDDRRDIRLLVRDILEEAGAEADVAANGRDAVEAASYALSEGHPHDAIIMDLQMPIMDGLEATRRIRSAGYERPIVALTAGALPERRVRAMEAGCTDFVTKPVRAAELLRRLTPYLEAVGEEDPALPEPKEEQEERTIPIGVRVLLIEDDADVARLMTLLFEEWGCSVRAAGSADEALECAGQDMVDAIVSDLSLPDRSGAELLAELRALPNCAHAYAVSLSGFAGAGGEQTALQAGFERHLVKPAPLDTLRDVIREAASRMARVHASGGGSG